MLRIKNKVSRYYTAMIDGITLRVRTRWTITLLLVCIYVFNMKSISMDVVTYLICFYLLHLLAAYFTPKGLTQEYITFQEYVTNQKDEEEEKKPLLRNLNEIQIWQRITLTFFMGTICSCFKLVNIDAFGPMLIMYAVALAIYTIKSVIFHMKKYGYSQKDFAKQPI